jgi:hypothetical protein
MPRSRKRVPGFSEWYGLAMLGLESQQVIALRMLRLAQGGPAAQAEASRMWPEKLAAAAHAGERLIKGDSSAKLIAGYRRKVRANARRLSGK